MTATKETRTLRLIGTTGERLLTITTARGSLVQSTDYHLAEVAAPRGRAFEFRKSAVDGGTVYRVQYDAEHSGCGCRGFRAWTRCRHLAAVRKLVEIGEDVSMATEPKRGFPDVQCPQCGEQGSVTLALASVKDFRCAECEAEITADDVEAIIANWRRVLEWVRLAPVLEE